MLSENGEWFAGDDASSASANPEIHKPRRKNASSAKKRPSDHEPRRLKLSTAPAAAEGARLTAPDAPAGDPPSVRAHKKASSVSSTPLSQKRSHSPPHSSSPLSSSSETESATAFNPPALSRPGGKGGSDKRQRVRPDGLPAPSDGARSSQLEKVLRSTRKQFVRRLIACYLAAAAALLALSSLWFVISDAATARASMAALDAALGDGHGSGNGTIAQLLARLGAMRERDGGFVERMRALSEQMLHNENQFDSLLLEIEGLNDHGRTSQSRAAGAGSLYERARAGDGAGLRPRLSNLDAKYISDQLSKSWRSTHKERAATMERRYDNVDEPTNAVLDDREMLARYEISLVVAVNLDDFDDYLRLLALLEIAQNPNYRPCSLNERLFRGEFLLYLTGRLAESYYGAQMAEINAVAKKSALSNCILGARVVFRGAPSGGWPVWQRRSAMMHELLHGESALARNARFAVVMDTFTTPLVSEWLDRLAGVIQASRNGDFCVLGGSFGHHHHQTLDGGIGDRSRRSENEMPELYAGAEDHSGGEPLLVQSWAKHQFSARFSSGVLPPFFLAPVHILRLNSPLCRLGMGRDSIESAGGFEQASFAIVNSHNLWWVDDYIPRYMHSNVVVELQLVEIQGPADPTELARHTAEMHWDAVFLHSAFPALPAEPTHLRTLQEETTVLAILSTNVDSDGFIPLAQMLVRMAVSNATVHLVYCGSHGGGGGNLAVWLRLLQGMLGLRGVYGCNDITPTAMRYLSLAVPRHDLLITDVSSVVRSMGIVLSTRLLQSLHSNEVPRAVYFDIPAADDAGPLLLQPSVRYLLCTESNVYRCNDMAHGDATVAILPRAEATKPAAPRSGVHAINVVDSAPTPESIVLLGELVLAVRDDSSRSYEVRVSSAFFAKVPTEQWEAWIAVGAPIMRSDDMAQVGAALRSEHLQLCLACVDALSMPGMGTRELVLGGLAHGAPLLAPPGAAAALANYDFGRRRGGVIEYWTAKEMIFIVRKLHVRNGISMLAAYAATAHSAQHPSTQYRSRELLWVQQKE